jgi:hypothetical protein
MVEGHVPQGVWVQVPPSASDGRLMAAFCVVQSFSRRILPDIRFAGRLTPAELSFLGNGFLFKANAIALLYPMHTWQVSCSHLWI